MNELRVLVVLVAVVGIVFPGPARAQTPAEFDRLLDGLPVVDEIDPVAQPPVHQFPEDASRVAMVLGRPARVLEAGERPKVMAWVIGRAKGLKPGAAYLLEVEYPDDVPRSLFVANRGADLVRGFATGAAAGDCRQQYVQPSIESRDYPPTGKWQRHRMIFCLHNRFQGLYSQRDARLGGRPYGPADGFHVIIFQSRRLNDPRSQGAAIGQIRLRAVPDLAALYPSVEYPPEDLPRRRVFWREEMADEAVQARDVNDRGVADPLDWLVFKARMARLLAINTFAKDLLEFGWALVPSAFDKVVSDNSYALSLGFRERISSPPDRTESFHSARAADPPQYRDNPRVMLTFPIGRLFTVARADLMDRYRTGAGLTVVRHYTLIDATHEGSDSTPSRPGNRP